MTRVYVGEPKDDQPRGPPAISQHDRNGPTQGSSTVTVTNDWWCVWRADEKKTYDAWVTAMDGYVQSTDDMTRKGQQGERGGD